METQVKKRLLDVVYSINNGSYDSAEIQLPDLGKGIDEGLKKSEALGFFQDRDSSFKQSFDDMLVYLRDTAYFHFDNWLSYRKTGEQGKDAFLDLSIRNPVIQDRLSELEDVFGLEQEAFAKRYDIVLVEDGTTKESEEE